MRRLRSPLFIWGDRRGESGRRESPPPPPKGGWGRGTLAKLFPLVLHFDVEPRDTIGHPCFLGRQSIMVNFVPYRLFGVLPPGLSGQRRMKRESGARPGQTRCRKLHRELPLTLYSPLLPYRQWEGCEGREQAGRPAIVSRVKCFRGKESCLSRNQPTHCRIYAIAAPAIHPTLSPGDHDSCREI